LSEAILKKHRQVWARKPALRDIYAAWYRQIKKELVAGKILEIGGGSGNLKDTLPETITSDLVHLPWVDLVSDAHTLPFKNSSMENIILFDVLHHLENPTFFFDEALRILCRGGRLLLMEPYVSLLSYPVYRFLHPEPLDLHQDPFELQHRSLDRKPFDANQAIPTLFFFRHFKRFKTRYPQFELRRRTRIGFWAYPLSGGFDHPTLIPAGAINPLIRLERMLDFLSAVFAFRMFIVLEKQTF